MSQLSYYKESLIESFSQNELNVTEEQLDAIVSDVCGMVENESMCLGYDVTGTSPSRTLESLEAENRLLKERILGLEKQRTYLSRKRRQQAEYLA